LINLQTIENVDVIFPLRNTGGVGVAGSNPAVPTNDFNDFRCSLEAAEVFFGRNLQKIYKSVRISFLYKKVWGSFFA